MDSDGTRAAPGFGALSVLMPPGRYTVKLTVGGQSFTQPLEVRKVYRLLAPLSNDPKSWVRVVDESGEDYLYPKQYFRPLLLPRLVQRALAAPQA